MLPRLPQRPLRQVLPEISPANGEAALPGGILPGLPAEPDVCRGKRCRRCACWPAMAARSSRPKKRSAAECRRWASERWNRCSSRPAITLPCSKRRGWNSLSPIAPPAVPRSKITASILADDPLWAERAAAFSKKVRDISEFLLIDPVGKAAGTLEAASPITIPATCGAARASGNSRAPCCK